MKTKKCSTCKEIKPINEFTKKRTSTDGLASQCRVCTRKCVRNHYYNNKQYYFDKNKRKKKKIKDWLENYKKDKVCIRCGESRFYCLDFHHRIKEEKEYCVTDAYVFGTWRFIKKEIDKCDILCANCHRELHWLENHTE